MSRPQPFLVALAAAVLAASGAGSRAQCEINQLTAIDRAAGDSFGGAIAVDGDWAVVGARNDDGAAGANTGAAYVFRRAGFLWSQSTKLVASDGAAGDLFGSAVAISGNRIVIGAPNDDNSHGTDAGALYVFVYDGTNWTQTHKITASDGAASDLLGTSVAISGSRIAAGAPQHNTAGLSNAGQIYTYVYSTFPRPPGGWPEEARFAAADTAASDQFGHATALDNDALLIGAPYNTNAAGAAAGAAYIFRRGTGWAQEAKLIASSQGAGSGLFGWSVAIDTSFGDPRFPGQAAVVGAPQVDDVTSGFTLLDTGGAFYYAKSGASWSPGLRLTPSVIFERQRFGHSVALRGDRVAAGSPTSQEAWEFYFDGTQPYDSKRLTPSESMGGTYGIAVATNGTQVLVGDDQADPGGLSNAGAAYAFSTGGFSCYGAVPITAGVWLGCNNSAPTEGSSSCGPSSSSVWYSYIAPVCGVATFDCLGALLEFVVSVNSASTCPGTQVACDLNGAGPGESVVHVPVVAGTEYRIRIAGLNGQQGRFLLTVTDPAGPPPGNTCAAAVPIAGTGSFPFDTFCATTDGLTPTSNCGSQIYNDVWFAWTPAAAGAYIIDTCATSPAFNTILALYPAGSACPPGPATLACNDNSCGLLSRLSISGVAAGQTYLVRVGTSAPSITGGPGVLTITPVAATGRCCAPGSCSITTQSACAAMGGVYGGDNTDCSYAPDAGCSGFEDIASTGTDSGVHCDDCGASVPIGFTFNFYGVGHTTVNACSNGYLTFGSTLTAFDNVHIPSASAPDDMICPLWDDLRTDTPATARLLYETRGAAPGRRFIAQWTGVSQFDDSSGATHTFQVVLYEGSGRIEFRYLTIAARYPAADFATVGVENPGGTLGVDLGEPEPGQRSCSALRTPSCAAPCRADTSHDGRIDVQDYLALLQLYAQADPAADINGDGQVNVQDYLAYLSLYAAGCP
jgi:hypothetical protein